MSDRARTANQIFNKAGYRKMFYVLRPQRIPGGMKT